MRGSFRLKFVALSIFAASSGLMLPIEAKACGPEAYPFYCLAYGEGYRGERVAHLDPNNLTEHNFAIFFSELLGNRVAPDLNPTRDYEDNVLPPLPPEPHTYDHTRGVAAFRREDYVKAIEFFTSSVKEDNHLKANSTYFLARSYLRASQAKFDGYQVGAPFVDVEYAKKAAEQFQKFAKAYPEHDWAQSAKGLIRRANFLAGDHQQYADSWSAAVEEVLAEQPRDEEKLLRLFYEAANLPVEFLSEPSRLHPFMWLIRSYFVTRKSSAELKHRFDLNVQLQLLEADQRNFKRHKDLYAWSRATLLLALGRAEEGYTLLQKQPVAKTNNGSLSWVMLNARLLLGMKEFDKARETLARFIKSHSINNHALETKPLMLENENRYWAGPTKNGNGWYLYRSSTYTGAIAGDAGDFYAMTFVYERNVHGLLAESVPALIGWIPVLRVFIQGIRTDQIVGTLERKDLSKSTRAKIESHLFLKLLVAGDWSKVLQAYELLQTEGLRKRYAEIVASVRTLTTSPDDPEANARMGLFLSALGSGQGTYASCEGIGFAKLKEPMDYFIQSLEQFVKRDLAKVKRSKVEAAMLKTMITCYKPSGFSPFCGHSWRPDIGERADWFKRLKSKYANSAEAKDLKYYW